MFERPHNAAGENIVAEVIHKWFLTEKLLGDFDDMSQTLRFFLENIGNFKAPFFAVAKEIFNFGAGFVDDNADFFDAGFGNRFDGIQQERFIGDRNQVLV